MTDLESDKHSCERVPKMIVITATNLGPYHRARYHFLAQAVDLLIVTTPVGEFERPWKPTGLGNDFRSIAPFGRGGSWSLIWREARNLFRVEAPDVVVCVGYNRRFVWIISLLSHWIRIPCLLYLVGWKGERKRSSWKEYLKRIYCRRLFDASLVTGSRAAEYAKSLGFYPDRIFLVGNVVDNDHFAFGTTDVRLASEAQLPADYFLSVLRLNKDKNVDLLLKAFADYRRRGGKWSLCIAGKGPDEQRLKASVDYGANEAVRWLGWRSHEELPELYHRSKCFILPSRVEPWGLVVNEAMAAGLPILLSTQCGCQPDLLFEGENGHSFEWNDRSALTKLMLHMERLSESELEEMGRKSRQIINGYTLDSWRNAFVQAIESVIGHT